MGATTRKKTGSHHVKGFWKLYQIMVSFLCVLLCLKSLGRFERCDQEFDALFQNFREPVQSNLVFFGLWLDRVIVTWTDHTQPRRLWLRWRKSMRLRRGRNSHGRPESFEAGSAAPDPTCPWLAWQRVAPWCWTRSHCQLKGFKVGSLLQFFLIYTPN